MSEFQVIRSLLDEARLWLDSGEPHMAEIALKEADQLMERRLSRRQHGIAALCLDSCDESRIPTSVAGI